MSDLECPYCEADLDVCHDDGFGYDEDTAHEMNCAECGKNFVFSTEISFDYHPKQADCLNGKQHNFRKWSELWRSPSHITLYRRCQDCDHQERDIKHNHTGGMKHDE